MRYTLRLLTLDQLGRAATLICALELERQKDAEKLGRLAVRDRPVGRPGRDAEPDGRRRATTTANRRARKTIAFQNDDRQAVADPARGVPLVRHEVQAELVPAAAQPGRADRPARRLREPAIATSAAAVRCRSWPSMSRSTAGCRAS